MILRKRRRRATIKKNLVTYANPDSLISDQFREIRANINFLTETKKNRLFIITSPDKGEGKSTVTANLAVSMAQQNERILLIDANLREPTMHDIFKIPNNVGLTNILSGNASMESAIQRTWISNLELLTSGTTLTNPAEVLGNTRIADLLNTTANTYDKVLIDSPPVLTSTETRVLANHCDGVVMVLNRGKTALENTVESRRVLELARAKIVGAIMNEK
ncbi:CpsD/CapB family tyrosine-protein kinase [Lentibacillus sp. Marseille-P4043]|uniref:CpsD/CapB family tyrosine-protein kinase n=1 Tax=Lentibacillus sp. Marseille-P4043 TaxID=2040293 RepID=UPI001F25510A|nr:CpsD/CapB family tyrosine-protein kinase [Lentibacillus sp. Marseille-P4043]